MAIDLIAQTPGLVREAELGTHKIAYADLGSGDPIIFTHGGLMDHQSWGNQVPLADSFRMILPDTRGHGRSGGANLPATYAAFADDIIALMDSLGLERANLVGFSDGGCTALSAVLRHPGRIGNLVLIGTPYNRKNYNPGVTLLKEDLEKPSSPLVKEVLGKMRMHMTAVEWEAYCERMLSLWASEPNFTLPEFAAMHVRTLILHGESEKYFGKEHSEDLAATIPDCQLHYVPAAGHSAAQENPGFVNDAISRFLGAQTG